jgi:DNA-binding NarL/FixJ family response regulator
MTYREQPNGNLAVLLCALSFATGLGLSERMEQLGDKVEPADALRKIRRSVGTQFDESCYDALAASLTSAPLVKRTAPERRQLGNLTEREAEVLRLLAQGQSNPQIAKALVISRKTVEHHLEHIYNKIGVTCRTSAVVYAVQHGIA